MEVDRDSQNLVNPFVKTDNETECNKNCVEQYSLKLKHEFMKLSN